MAERAEQDKWVARVLGVAMPSAGAASADAAPTDGARLMSLWQDAKDEVDERINALVAALRDEGDPDLDQIADCGLIGVTAGTSTQLMKALFQYRSALPDGRGQAAASLRKAAETYRSTVFAHPLIDLIDENPWNVEVGLRSRLGAALDTILREAA